jgi:hypothetical protein
MTPSEQSVSVAMVDVEGQLLAEIADPRMKRADVALTYAFAIRQGQQGESIDYAKVNHAIIERWSMAGLRWIKTEAWAWVEGKRS